MTTLDTILDSIVDHAAPGLWLVLADWLEEHDDPRRAELVRLHQKLLSTCCEPDSHLERPTWQARLVELLAQGVKPCVPQRTVALAEGVEMAFSFIPPGSFQMGSPVGEPERSELEMQHWVTLTKGFWLGVYPVTQAQWQSIMGSNPSSFQGNDRPVEAVSWGDCVQFCGEMRKRTGQQVRLPTEAEWAYACRAGTTTTYHTGDGLAAMKRAGWCGYDSFVLASETMRVGQFKPNAWGLFDMHGNISEWLADGFADYPQEDARDPQGEKNGTTRVLRGGSWYRHPGYCRSAHRIRGIPAFRNDDYGFRVLLCLD